MRCDVSQPARGWEVASYAALGGETGPQWLRKRCGGKACRRVARVAFPTVQTVQPQTMACCLENGELCCGDGLPVLREGASWWVTRTHSSREPEGSVHFIIPQVWCRGLLRLLWGVSAKEKWSGIPVPTRQPLRFSMQIRASNLRLHCWLPISCDPRWRHGVKIATCVGGGGGGC